MSPDRPLGQSGNKRAIWPEFDYRLCGPIVNLPENIVKTTLLD
jgi:hypothetical protein